VQALAMKLIVGLGNPGRQYENTRHNVGFRVIGEVARRWQIEVTRHKFSGRFGGGRVRNQPVGLLEPTTYMNLSGQSVREAVAFHRVPIDDLLIVVDDLALPLGRLRIRAKGSGGGHNGLTNVIDELGDDGFARLRIGINWVSGRQAVDHVLGTFSAEEEPVIAPAVFRAADVVECWVEAGIETAMNRFNRPEEEPGG